MPSERSETVPEKTPDHVPADGAATKSLTELLDVMRALRTPVTGCPWDLVQTSTSIAPYTIEEAYEVVDAIQRGNLVDLREELGDLLLQVVFHAQMASEAGAFSFADVADGIAKKMRRRHPHVFGDDAARSAGAAKGFWEAIKAQEKAAKETAAGPLASAAPAAAPRSVLADVPVGMPALTRAVKLQEKAARVGFDWPAIGPVFDKMREEIAELEVEVASGETAKIQDEFGDLLFVMANLARHLGVDPEAAVRSTNAKFTRRFQGIEAALAKVGRSPAVSDLAEMDALWNAVKKAEPKG
jgi:nucleoside triphosphate diphosphatase